ncbi:PAP2 superfamily protein [Motilibacter peucedani]|uniref:PAP2 superfamily protein n=1 Tax=Motilibacter peucedani TaxID=598650 RepID=A0A420XN66_9ACTN|nr:phosphatase PAP2 family protein [Motilibacter peucedani]RKS72712.1 PAP2 superfamily protein [Motilibacter peucedani]
MDTESASDLAEGAAVEAVAGAVKAVGRRVPAGAREIAIVAVLLLAYKLGRLISADETARAFSNAQAVLSLEHVLRLPREAWTQSVAYDVPSLVDLANRYYAYVHFPAATLMLLVLWFRARHHYAWVRRVMALLTLTALVLHVVLPLAPPRMMPGFIDTAAASDESVYSGVGGMLANQYAAMPSLHVGWALVVAAAVVVSLRSRWRWLAVLHPAVTVAVVVVTANHYWLDAIVAGALFVISLTLVGPRGALVPRRAYAVAA